MFNEPSETLRLINHALSFLAAMAVGLCVSLAILALTRIAIKFKSRDVSRLGGAVHSNNLLTLFKPVFDRLAFIAAYTSRPAHRDWMRGRLLRANLYGLWTPELIETLKVGAALASVLCVAGLSLALGFYPSFMVMSIVAVIAYFLPDLVVNNMATSRQERLRRALPFMIDLLAAAAETGLAFQQAVGNVITNSMRGVNEEDIGEDGERELTAEMETVLSSVRMGRTLEYSLNEVAQRIGVDEFTSFAAAISQAEKMGSPISDALKQQSRELRVKLAARMEAKAAKVPVKILFPLMIFIFPVTAWVIVGPVILTLLYGGGE